MAQYIKRDDAILRVIPPAVFDIAEAQALASELSSALEGSEGPFAILVEHYRTSTITAPARRVLAEVAQNPKLGRVAFLGGSVFMRTVASFIIRASGRTGTMRFFERDAEAEARAWAEGAQ